MTFLRQLLNYFIWTIASLVIAALIAGAVLYEYMEYNLPDVSVLNDVHLQVPMEIYSSDGKLMAEYGAKRRIPITLNEVPKPLIEALLATEDARFYSHPGVDLIGMVRAMVAVASTGRKVQGASTITMQVARNFFLTRKKTYSRKLREILLAIKIDRTLSKNKILELYLNKIYFGNRAYGVAAAAQVYYGKNLNQLTLAQMAMIAGLPQAPSRNNPLTNPKNALERRNHVLKRMFDVGYINRKTYEKTIHEPLTARYHEATVQLDAPYIAEMTRAALVMMYGNRVYDSGLKVYTSINSRLQIAATDALRNGLNAYATRHKNETLAASQPVQGAIIVLNPKNGAILALQGGYDYATSAFNRAIQAFRQPGSSFKPFIYSAALNHGYTLATVVNDAPLMIRDRNDTGWWRPENDTLEFYGPTRLRVGLTESRNLVSIRLLRALGLPYTLNYLQRFGFDPDRLPHELSLALGSGVVTPLQMAAGYTTFANGGYQITPFFIEKIETEHDHELYQANPAMADVLSPDPAILRAPRTITPQNAYLMTQAMRGVIRSGTAKAALVLKRDDLAGKTGTTNDQMDAWFSGFNSNLVATVWVGYDKYGQSLDEYGAQVALPIWIQFMKSALENQSEATMSEPDDIVTARIDPKTGYLASPRQRHAIFEVFDKKDLPKQLAVNPHASIDMNENGSSDMAANDNEGLSDDPHEQIF